MFRNDANHIDARFPVQTVIRPQDPAAPEFRGLAGQVASGVFRPGEEIVHLPGGLKARITAIHGPGGKVAEAFHPMSVVMELDRDLADLQPRRNAGQAQANQPAAAAARFEAMLCWLGDHSARPRAPLRPAAHLA